MAVNTYGALEFNFAAGPLAGKVWNVDGALTFENRQGGETTVKAYKNGQVSRAFNPMPVKASASFERPSTPLDQAAYLGEHSIVIREVQRGLTHTFVNAVLSGSASESAEDGSLSGLSIECAYADYSVE